METGQMSQGLLTLFKSDGRVKVWRSSGETYNKIRWGSVMFWGVSFGPLVLVDGNMDSEAYINVLANNFIPWVRDYLDSVFQQDGAPCHTSLYSTWWMSTHGIRTLNWVAQSPDLNPIENLWNHLDRQVRKRKPLPQTKQDLITAIQEEWSNISLEKLQNLIMSLPHRIEAVIKAKGGNTKY